MDLQKHSNNVRIYSYGIGKILGITNKELMKLTVAAYLHDIGKTQIPYEILNKPSKLTSEEFEIMKQHSLLGSIIVKEKGFDSCIVDAILYHHERLDGKGYGTGLKGDSIPLFSKIIGVADAYDAMTSNRPYHKAIPHIEAIKELERNSGTQFDEELVSCFKSYFNYFYLESRDLLNVEFLKYNNLIYGF